MKKNRDLSSLLQGKRQKENRKMSLCTLLQWTASPLPRISGPQESSLTAVSENRLRSWVCSLALSLEMEMLGCRSAAPLSSLSIGNCDRTPLQAPRRPSTRKEDFKGDTVTCFVCCTKWYPWL